ncbi:hypothetical protein ACIQXI_01795 [Lysinibacillus sp. NPDC097195]|uniref:hypothetical protein n=1 Tax=Lysinibacillus sp. NPDC097195 TaxID=3364141 RepID=UPI0038270036
MDNKKERRKIIIAENGGYIVPKERMEELIKRIDELIDKAGLGALNSDYCCFVSDVYTNIR